MKKNIRNLQEKPKIRVGSKANNFFRHKERHQFHLVGSSQLPILTALSALLLVMGIVFYGHPSEDNLLLRLDKILLHVASIAIILVLFSGFVSIIKESREGHHTSVVQNGLRLGMILFIVSEIFFFFAFFGAFFHFSLAPSIFIGCVGPPKGIQPLDIGGLPLVNTLLLLSSGVTITFAHHAILKANTFHHHKIFAKYLLATIILGITFLFCQGIEYKYGITFSGNENVYGSTFFVTTGFHGLHVTLGTIFLGFCLVREGLTTYFSKYVKDEKTLFFAIVKHLIYVYMFFIKILPVYGLLVQEFLAINIMVELGLMKKTELRRRKKVFIKLGRHRKETVHQHCKFIYRMWMKGTTLESKLVSFGFTSTQHLGFEAAAGYGHFVDVVGLFLFVTIYGGGN